jgi:hypothetical protein
MLALPKLQVFLVLSLGVEVAKPHDVGNKTLHNECEPLQSAPKY